jgi:transcriptional regulator
MYVPHRYKIADAEIDEFVRAHGFGLLVTNADGTPTATHIPVELLRGADGERLLEGHVARANRQWQSLTAGSPALVVFAGPHAYISASWYDHENVPTWNYQAVHMSGPLALVHDPAELLAMVRRLARHYEPEAAIGGFDVDRMTPRLRDAELAGIVGFRIRVERVEAAFKLSQNRDAANLARVVTKLRERGDANSVAVAAAMEELSARRPQR